MKAREMEGVKYCVQREKQMSGILLSRESVPVVALACFIFLRQPIYAAVPAETGIDGCRALLDVVRLYRSP